MRPSFVLVAMLLAFACTPADASPPSDVVLEVDAQLDGSPCGSDPGACCPEGYAPVGWHVGAVVCLG